MKVGAIIQARMSSQRCPGKVLRDLGGQPVLAHVADALAACHTLQGICVATSLEPADDAISEFCGRSGITCFRGSLENVAARCAVALTETQWDAFVRISADSPLIDHRIVTHAVSLMHKSDCDLVTNVFPRSFPTGQSVEVIRRETFERIVPQLVARHHQEHVTPYFYEHANAFRIRNFAADRDYSAHRLTIDTEEDHEVILQVVTSLSRQIREYPWKVLASLELDFRQQAMGVPL